MTGTDSYSTTPATNATADGGAINWAEGQPPSSVNNSARQWMADERASFNDLIWFQYGTGDQGAGNIAVPAVYASSTSFTIVGANVTAVYHVNRRVRAVGVSTGTIFGTISATSYSSGNTTTTVTVVWDSGSLSNETLTVSLSQVPVTGSPIGGGIRTWTPTDLSGGTLTFSAVTAKFQLIGQMCFAQFQLTFPVTADGNNVLIGGLPFAAPATIFVPCQTLSFAGAGIIGYISPTTSSVKFQVDLSTGATQYRNLDLSATTISVQCFYPIV